MATEEKHVTTSIGIKVSVSVAVRTAIERILYGLAQQHTADAEMACKSGKRNDELNDAIRTIILATACLEAFINQEAIQVLDQDFDAYDKGFIDAWGKTYRKRRGYPTLEDKWFEITNRISNKQFNKGEEPFQSFHKLVELRNEILHYKGIPAAPVPSTCHHVPGVIPPERAKFTAKAAKAAVESMRAMLEKFHILTGKQKQAWIK
jgi:hypothetical protein